MGDHLNGKRVGREARPVSRELFEQSLCAPNVPVQGNEGAGVELREISIDAIEPDPTQPRRLFDEEKLKALAESIRKHGLLQEPGVILLDEMGGKGAVRYRLVWGERRWRASRLAGLSMIRCKVLARADDPDKEFLLTKDRQWAENVEREALSPVEEGVAILDAAQLEQKRQPDVPLGELVERIGAERGLHGTVARNLVALLRTPRSLQAAMMSRRIGREVGFELARFWNKLLATNELRGPGRREIQYRNVVVTWARARGEELGARTMTRYAAETFQDPEVVRETCRKAEQLQRAVLARFDTVVERAQHEKWTVKRAKLELKWQHARGAASAEIGAARVVEATVLTPRGA